MILKAKVSPQLGTLTVVLKCNGNKEQADLRKHFTSGECQLVKATVDTTKGEIAIAIRPPGQTEAAAEDNSGSLTVEGEDATDEEEEEAEHVLGDIDVPVPEKITPLPQTGNRRYPAVGSMGAVQDAARGKITAGWSKDGIG